MFQIYVILSNGRKPHDNDSFFPFHKIYSESRNFNISWLQRYSWLVY